MSSTDTSGNRWEPTDDNAGTTTLAAPDSTPANPSPPELDGPDTDGNGSAGGTGA